MRALASRLGVAPNALYSHVPSKTALLDDLLDDLLAAVQSPDPDTADPAAGLTVLMQSTYDVLTAHPDLVPLFLSRQGARGANAARLGQIMDALLERAGLTGPAGTQARRVLIVHTIGSAAFAASPAQDDDRPLSARRPSAPSTTACTGCSTASPRSPAARSRRGGSRSAWKSSRRSLRGTARIRPDDSTSRRDRECRRRQARQPRDAGHRRRRAAAGLRPSAAGPGPAGRRAGRRCAP